MPGQELTAAVRFKPPRSPTVRAGEIAFGVRVHSSVAGPGPVYERGGTVTVTAFTEIRTLIVPATSEGVDGAEHTITVQNEGNVTTEVNLSVADPEEVLAFALQPPKHVLEPGESAVSRLRVWLRQGISRPGQRLPFQVIAEPVRMSAVVIDGAFRQTPRPEPVPIKRGRRPWIPLAGIAAVVALALMAPRSSVERSLGPPEVQSRRVQRRQLHTRHPPHPRPTNNDSKPRRSVLRPMFQIWLHPNQTVVESIGRAASSSGCAQPHPASTSHSLSTSM